MAPTSVYDAGRAIAGLLGYAPVAGARTRQLPPALRDSVRRATQIANAGVSEQGRAYSQVYQKGVDDLARAMADEGPSGEYFDFLQAHGVSGGTVDRVRSGELDMSPAAREQRARDLGLNPDLTVWRLDDPGKATVLGRARNGLVYTSFTPGMAREAAQHPYAAHPLWGAAHIAGVDPAPRPLGVDDLIERLRRLAMRDSYHQWHHFVTTPESGLAFSQNTGLPLPMASATPPAKAGGLSDLEAELAEIPTRDQWLSLPAVRFGAVERGRLANAPAQLPSDAMYGRWDPTGSMVDDLKDMGYQGMIVADEAPRSVAYFGATAEKPMPSVRHSVLSALDPEHRFQRNIFMSLPLVAPAAAASVNLEQR